MDRFDRVAFRPGSTRRRRFVACRFESLEARALLAADLLAQWRAEDLATSRADGDVVSTWTDSASGLEATRVDGPALATAGIGGRAALRLDPSRGLNGLRVRSQDNPMNGLTDFTVLLTFATDSSGLIGDQGAWFENSGLLDGNSLGLSSDWGITLNSQGQLAVGFGRGFGVPPLTFYSTVTGLHDGLPHTVAVVRQGSSVSLYVDQGAAEVFDDAPAQPLSSTALGIGQLSTQDNPFAGQIAEVRLYDGPMENAQVRRTLGEIVAFYDSYTTIAVDDRYQGLPSEVLRVGRDAGLLANDAGPQKATLQTRLVADVSAGKLTLQADGSFTYDPRGFVGITSFTYELDDGAQRFAPATVSLVLNTPPQPRADQFEVAEEASLTRAAWQGVLANDVDPDGDLLSASLVTPPQHGTLAWNADGSFIYTPDPDYFGDDEFWYSISDGHAASEPTPVTLWVRGVNDRPEVVDDGYVALPDRPLVVTTAAGVLANDRDIDGPRLEALLADGPTHGTLQLKVDGSFVYEPYPGFSGVDSFRYLANDFAGPAVPATVEVRVHAQPLVIGELMAANVDLLPTRTRATATDAFLRGSETVYDWIELRHPFDAPLDIDGFYLTDDPEEPRKWQIPQGTSIDAADQLVLFASGRDIVDPALDELGRLHTNFKLSAESGYLGVTSPTGQVVFEYTQYPDQRAGVSYGIDALGQPAFFLMPTPSAPNGLGLPGAVADTKFSLDRGFYAEPQRVTIASDTVGAEIYYTTDGSEPDPASAAALRYTEPVHVDSTTILRAAAFHPNLLPSNVDTQTYLFLGQVVNQGNTPEGYPTEWKDLSGNGSLPADYEMDPEITQHASYRDLLDDALLQIPTLSIVTDVNHLFDRDRGIYQNPSNDGLEWERPASVELILPDGSPGFQIDAGLRIQGGASREPEKSPKHSFRLLFKDVYGASKLNYPLFGAEAVDEFDTVILRAGFNQSYIHHNTFLGDNRGRAQYVRDQWAKDTQLAMGHTAAHNSYAHLYINGMYWGLYNPTERPTDGFAVSYLGGEKDEYDVINSNEVVDGNADAWNELRRRSRADLSDAANYQAVADMLDIDAFIDYMLINHFGGNMDWDSHNWYALRHRTEEGKFLFFTWDSEFIFIGNRDNRIRQRESLPGQLFHNLVDNDTFRMKLADAIQRNMFHEGLLTPGPVVERWNARSDQINLAIVAESARWGDYRRDVHQRGAPLELLERDVQWTNERTRLLNEYFPQRTATVVEQYRRLGLFPSLDAPSFNQRSGILSPGSLIALAAGDGISVYYTLDGSDPRLPDGSVNPAAIEYTGPFPLVTSAAVTVRGRSVEDEWSARDQVRFFVDSRPAAGDSLRISEIHYHPAPASDVEIAAGFDNDDDFEFLELVNISDQRIELSHVRLERSLVDNQSVGVHFEFAAGVIPYLDPGERVLVVEDTAAFAFRYSDPLPVAGQWSGGLSNSAEQITLRAGDQIIHQFTYRDQWQPATDGGGFSLEHIDVASSDLTRWSLAASWRRSELVGGTPGRDEVPWLPGDANHDGVFSSRDLVLVFQAGEYEDEIADNSRFEEGDWNRDGDFTTADLVLAFQAGGYAVDSLLPRAVESLFAEPLESPVRNAMKGKAGTERDVEDQLSPW